VSTIYEYIICIQCIYNHLFICRDALRALVNTERQKAADMSQVAALARIQLATNTSSSLQQEKQHTVMTDFTSNNNNVTTSENAVADADEK